MKALTKAQVKKMDDVINDIEKKMEYFYKLGWIGGSHLKIMLKNLQEIHQYVKNWNKHFL